MKIAKVQQIPNLVKSFAIAAPLLFATSTIKAQSFEQKADVFEKSKQACVVNNPKSVLQVEPIVIGDEDIYPALVLDLSKGRLYHYDLECYLYNEHKLSANNNFSGLTPGLKRITDISEEYDVVPSEFNVGRNVLSLENIDMKNGKTIGTDKIYIEQDSLINSQKNNRNKSIKLPKENLDFLMNNLYKEQYILIKK